MPTAPEGKLSHHGRIMKCVTFLLLLPETLKKVKRTSKHPGRLSLCYNILTLSLKKRMAAELYPVNDHATVQKNGTVMLSLPEKKRSVEAGRAVHRVHRHHTDHRAKHQQQQRGDSQLALCAPDFTRKARHSINWRIKLKTYIWHLI